MRDSGQTWVPPGVFLSFRSRCGADNRSLNRANRPKTGHAFLLYTPSGVRRTAQRREKAVHRLSKFGQACPSLASRVQFWPVLASFGQACPKPVEWGRPWPPFPGTFGESKSGKFMSISEKMGLPAADVPSRPLLPGTAKRPRTDLRTSTRNSRLSQRALYPTIRKETSPHSRVARNCAASLV